MVIQLLESDNSVISLHPEELMPFEETLFKVIPFPLTSKFEAKRFDNEFELIELQFDDLSIES